MNKIKKILLNIIAIMTAAIFIISGTANAEGGLDDIKMIQMKMRASV